LFAGLFEESLDGVLRFGSAEEGLTLVTTESDEVEVAGLLKAFETRWHGGGRSLLPAKKWDGSGRCERATSHPSQMREGWGTRSFEVGKGWATRQQLRFLLKVAIAKSAPNLEPN